MCSEQRSPGLILQLVLLRQHHLLIMLVTWVAGSASRLLCFLAREVTTVLWPLPHFFCFLPFSFLPHFQTKSITKFCPLVSLWPAASLAFLSHYVANYSLGYFTLSHTALLTLKLAKSAIKFKAGCPWTA